MMKWLMIFMLVIPVLAFSKADIISLDNAPVLSESMLEQQRGGFSLPGINYSIGLKMEALINGQRVFFSNMFNLDMKSKHPEMISDVAGVKGLNITALNGKGQLGFVVDNAASGVRADVILHIDVVTPVRIDTYLDSQRVSSRVRDAMRHINH